MKSKYLLGVISLFSIFVLNCSSTPFKGGRPSTVHAGHVTPVNVPMVLEYTPAAVKGTTQSEIEIITHQEKVNISIRSEDSWRIARLGESLIWDLRSKTVATGDGLPVGGNTTVADCRILADKFGLVKEFDVVLPPLGTNASSSEISSRKKFEENLKTSMRENFEVSRNTFTGKQIKTGDVAISRSFRIFENLLVTLEQFLAIGSVRTGTRDLNWILSGYTHIDGKRVLLLTMDETLQIGYTSKPHKWGFLFKGYQLIDQATGQTLRAVFEMNFELAGQGQGQFVSAKSTTEMNGSMVQ